LTLNARSGRSAFQHPVDGRDFFLFGRLQYFPSVPNAGREKLSTHLLRASGLRENRCFKSAEELTSGIHRHGKAVTYKS
jgi:hypothetical protein